MFGIISVEALSAFFQVVLIDVALAADNAVVIALAASGLDKPMRRKAILFGIMAATVLRIGFASVTVQLLQVTGLVLAGGILLLWVCWKMWLELHPEGLRAIWRNRTGGKTKLAEELTLATDPTPQDAGTKTLRQAVVQIMIADVSMSIDNVLAVAGAAREHPTVLIFGLGLSIALMGFAAMAIAKLLEKHRWIAYVGLAVVFYVALRMIYEGSHEVSDIVALL
ncbi:TerC family protein [Pseudooceanicola sp.]|uniref:TerC family protein n=1 Tax=Pseudooceanicola sp. TaxID=1914328 RepID=UPI0026392C90|nr:TerC family protein [Pseudooceanicola sp.]MDF1857191.1 TerC family protein [Pseudooceanicola sp.]